jgi:predicted TPR repeat methyltransferase
MRHQSKQSGSSGASGEHQPAVELAEWLKQAASALRYGDLFKAQALYQRILDARPEHAEALNGLGALQQQRGLLAQAEQLIRRAIRSAPGYASAYTHLGNVLIGQRRQADAIAAYRQAIALRTDEVEARINLGILFEELGRLQEALEAYQGASARRPADAEIHYRLGALLAKLGQFEEAITALEVTCQGNSDHHKAIRLLSALLQRQGRSEEARRFLGNVVFQRGGTKAALTFLQHWLRLMPDDPVPQHRLSAWFGQNMQARASNAYVTDLFDHYAEGYDRHLVEKLDYQAPAVIGARLAASVGAPAAQFDVLDAGCGTGLCAPTLRPYARHLTGVDLSPRMVDKARERGGYDELIVAELTAFLSERPGTYDLIVSADTLVYFGALETVSQAIAVALCPGGWLAFTVEQTTSDVAPGGYCLNQSGRYSHTAEYLDRVLAGAGLEMRTRADATLRQESNQPMVGHVVLARKHAVGMMD